MATDTIKPLSWNNNYWVIKLKANRQVTALYMYLSVLSIYGLKQILKNYKGETP